jgi:peptidyl-prolyl cis-trans isomerase A (cyclophilin A)
MTRTPGTYAVFETSEGTIVCRLFEKDAPKTVANFVELTEGKREWTHPTTRKKTKDPLYHGNDFSSRDSRLHDPGRRPDGHRFRRSRLPV